MRLASAAMVAALTATTFPAHGTATLYRVVQPDGTIVYTTERLPGAKPVSRDDVPPPPPEPAAPAAAPAAGPPPAAPAPREDARPAREKPAPR